MLALFPDPYPDELFYSVCARYSDRVNYRSDRALSNDLFGSRSALAIVDLPSRLSYIESNLPFGHHRSSDRIIDENTMLPFYALFLPPERLKRIRQEMKGNSGSAVHMLTGIMTGHIRLDRFRFCPSCSKKDREEFGEFYWHRIHQIPAVDVCSRHLVYLEESDTPLRNVRSRNKYISAETSLRLRNARSIDCSNQYQETLIKIARDAAWLLTQRQHPPGRDTICNRYLNSLAKRRLVGYCGRVLTYEFLESFKAQFPIELLKRLTYHFSENYKWPLSIFRHSKDSVQPPQNHLLLISYLGYTVEEFFNLPDSQESIKRQPWLSRRQGLKELIKDYPSPFGEGPWPCLNRVSNHYKKLQINRCELIYHRSTAGVTGNFYCDCGFVYSRRGPDKSPKDRLRRTRIKQFGYIWDAKLRQMWEDLNVSVNYLACRLGVNPYTAKMQAVRLGLPFPRQSRKQTCLKPHYTSESQKLDQKREQYRKVWLSAISMYPEAGRTLIYKKIPSTYYWLSQNDTLWHAAHMPPRKRSITANLLTHVNWQERDSLLAIKVKDAARNIKSANGPPQKVTETSIARDLDKTAMFNKHLNKLPLTVQSLSEVIETREAFAIRRIHRAADDFRERKIVPKPYQLIRKAGVHRLKDLPEVKQVLDEVMKSFLSTNNTISKNAA